MYKQLCVTPGLYLLELRAITLASAMVDIFVLPILGRCYQNTESGVTHG